ncbi:hypothetical protein [Sphingomonas endolithica]|uniref:hypothetical protein n=1 Tax=Sphingomonas endolithica TaxID=2972485 RepID=UPI0021B0738A|nr:hypothetical protein [Sphingomonas sp. ZFBP2030]
MSAKINKPDRVQAIELLRIVAAYGIVAYHAQAPLHDLAYAGLVIFLILSPMLDLRFNLDRIRSPAALARALLLPWAFWMVVYGAVNLAQHRPFVEASFMGILYGSSPHLWFLPFMFAVLTVLNMLKSLAPAILFYGSALVATALLLTVTMWRSASLEWSLPFPQ